MFRWNRLARAFFNTINRTYLDTKAAKRTAPDIDEVLLTIS
jgi:hypothetical protein